MTPEQEAQSFRDTIGPPLRAALARMSEHIDDPTELELAVSEILPAELGELPLHVIDAALEVVRDAPGGAAALNALAVSGSTAISIRARALLDETGDSVSLRLLRVAEAWELDNDEPVTAIHLICTREEVPGRQLFAFVVELALTGGAIKAGFAVPASHGEEAITGLHTETGRNGLELRPLEADAALELIVAAARRGAELGVAPDRDGITALAVLLRASEITDADGILSGLESSEPLDG